MLQTVGVSNDRGALLWVPEDAHRESYSVFGRMREARFLETPFAPLFYAFTLGRKSFILGALLHVYQEAKKQKGPLAE